MTPTNTRDFTSVATALSNSRELHGNSRRASRQHQAGFSLVVAVSVFFLAAALGYMVLQNSFVETESAGANRAHDAALWAAEMGLYWAYDRLGNQAPYFLNTQADPSALTSMPALQPADQPCPENSRPCTDGTWYFLDAESTTWQTFSNAFDLNDAFLVYAKLENAGDNQTPWVILIRSRGRTSQGNQRLLEVALSEK